LNIILPTPLLKHDVSIGDKISYRRKKILELRFKGLPYPQIAQELGYSLSTIEKDICVIRKFWSKKNEFT